MAKKILKKKKPAEIVELEKFYEVTLFEQKSDFIDDTHFRSLSYSVNAKGNVISLSIARANIKDLAPMSILKDLIYLNLTGNLIEDISPLFPQKDLKYVYIGGNKISDLYPLTSSNKLLKLAIFENQIDKISLLKSFRLLEELYCQSMNIVDLKFIVEMKDLRILSATNNNIRDLSPLLFLDNLTRVSLEHNNVDDITFLKKMQFEGVIELRNNLIKDIPKSIAEKFSWLKEAFQPWTNLKKEKTKIVLSENPLEFPPASVIELGPEITKNYYETTEQYGYAPLSEGRIIVIGDGSSGKSSIIEKILYNTFEKGRTQTNGIKIEHLHLQHPEDKRDLTFHIWDFGGQEIQHAVHKFFFTEGCLYILVLDNRKEEEPEYWLQQIESLGGKAPVLVVFNKQDENAAETADRKFLKDKYPNIVGFHNTSCETGFGVEDLKRKLEVEVVKLRTVDEQFPNNWLAIKKAIEERTSGSQHYLTYEVYQEICKQNSAEKEETQKLLLKYFNTIGAVTWFGNDTHLKFLHVLNPAWITQGVYKILTAKKTANLFGQINISDFKELLQPVNKEDYSYDEKHYGYILSMMKKFDLCDAPDDKHLLIPSAFGKVPKVEYADFKGENVRTYIMQFKDYMPLALIHRYITKKLPQALDNNYWYTGIVIKDSKSNSVAMIHADKEAKRIYVRIKDGNPLGVWEHFRREFADVTKSYAKISYDELVAVDEVIENNVNYEDLINYLKAKKRIYFHPKLRKDFNVGYLIGMFQTTDETIEKIKKGEIIIDEREYEQTKKIPPVVLNIINNISPVINAQINAQIEININIEIVNNLSLQIKDDANYLIDEIEESNKTSHDALKKIIAFAEAAKTARNSDDLKGGGWGRKLKSAIIALSGAGESLKNIHEGGDALASMFHGVKELALQFNLSDIVDLVTKLF